MKAPGPDCIQNWVWVLAWDVIEGHILNLFQEVTNQGYPAALESGKDDYVSQSWENPLHTAGILLPNCAAQYHHKAV